MPTRTAPHRPSAIRSPIKGFGFTREGPEQMAMAADPDIDQVAESLGPNGDLPTSGYEKEPAERPRITVL